ncbi:MAG: LuxR C-terminal-related transcriptional regulator [Bacillota bacterium]|nr:LuxR C-terminal-related transcriptional regulator [Bacillota bacterium]
MKKTEILNRERIYKALSVIYDYPLTIVEAPMGYGKTTAVRNFLKIDKKKSLWVTFLNSGESATSFWDKLVSEIARLNENVSSRLKSLGFPIDTPQVEKVLSLLNDLFLKDKVVLVIDDFHLSPDLSINKLMYQVIFEKIENLHIVVITRDTTKIDFAEMLSKGLCFVISQQVLKFSEFEIKDYCRIMHNTISTDEIIKITEYTDGWISLIYMILLGLENGIPVGMNSSIDQLVEKVLFNAYDSRIQSFLLKLSIMDVFTTKQALYVTREEKSNEILKKLHKENAFVFYDETAKTYKIHNVLLDYLRIKQQFTPEETRTLYRRLGEWHLERNDFLSAYSCFNHSDDFDRILSHLNQPENIRNELTSFEGSFEMFSKIPREVLYKYPLAYLQHILLTIVKGNDKTIVGCSKQLDDLKKAYEEMENIDEDYRNRILAEILIFRRFTSFNIISPTSDCNDEIMRLLNGQQSCIMRRENEFTMGSPHLLYVYFRDQGGFKQLSELAIERFSTYAAFANGCGSGSDYLIHAEYALETGDWQSAELNSFKAIYKARTKEQISIIICANFTLIRLYLLQGKISEAVDMLKQLEQEVAEINNPVYNTTIDMLKGYIYACLDQPEKIPCWLQTGNMSEADLLYQGVAFNYIVYGKSVMLSRNYVELEILTESFQEYFSVFSNQLGFIHNNIFEAVAKYHLYGLKEGVTALENALEKGQADYIIMPFIENGPRILDMLKVIENKASNNEYIKIIVQYSEQYVQNLKNNQPEKVKLSQRETEVLSLAAEGLKRDEIAVRLQLSQGTVKTHLQNIYQKLDASGKTAAIKIAQKHGLI